MPAQEPTVNVLLKRFSDEVQSTFYPFLVVSILAQRESATKQEIKDEIQRLTGNKMQRDDASYKQLIGRLDKTFGLIEPVDRAATTYCITPKGERLYSESLREVIQPLKRALPKQ